MKFWIRIHRTVLLSHPEYNPGHTMPYAPPETFQTIKKFKCSSDMFSFGVILFRIMMNDFPFVPSE